MSGNIVDSFGVAATLAAQRIVAAAATDNTVQYPAAAQLPLGITLDTVLDTTSSIPVQRTGIAKVFFNDTVAAGGLVGVDTSGRAVPFVSPNTTTSATLTSAYIGVLVGPAVAATGTIAQVAIAPGLERASS